MDTQAVGRTDGQRGGRWTSKEIEREKGADKQMDRQTDR
jgi:hypothetical protein